MTEAVTPPARKKPRLWRGLLLSLGAVAVLAGGEFYALYQHGRSGRSTAPVVAPAPVPASAPTPAATAAPASVIPVPTTVGWVDTPAAETVISNTVSITGWVMDPVGIQGVYVRVDGTPHPARYGLPRPDVAAAKAGAAGAAHSGFAFDADFSALSLQRHELVIFATNTAGVSTTLARRSLVPPKAMSMWTAELDENPGLKDSRFYFLMATSGANLGGAAGIETAYAQLNSATQKTGMSVPVLYMRTTRGAAGDWTFDPNFDLTRKCHARLVAEDNLTELMAYSVGKQIPVNFILNGGIWGDASCYSGEWDLTTHLEVDPGNCQWDQDDVVLPGDYAKGLTGSTESPELSRSLTYNIYNKQVRDYKRRNLQSAARIIAVFAREHPDLFVGVNLDADTYMNPFVRGGRRYDYNPGMLRQFRDWLAGTGPYAGHASDGAPDLRYYRRKQVLSLADVNRLAGQHWTAWSQVQPPRVFPGTDNTPVAVGEIPFWHDPWYQEWDVFRKHIVQLHYAELAEWTHAAGVPASRIFTAQAFTGQDPGLRPISTYVNDRSPDYDSAGVSIEGAVPRVGHLGTIQYGQSARNEVELNTGHNLFATIARFDRQWAVVETNATDLKQPNVYPVYAQSYHQFRDLFNYGARQVALMAWNGNNGIYAGLPGYTAYTSWRNTPAEQAMMDFMVSHADVPRGSLMWTFGSATYSDTDGWMPYRGEITADHGALNLKPLGDRVTLRSPPDQVIRPEQVARMILRFDGDSRLQFAVVSARSNRDDEWHVVARGTHANLAFAWPREWTTGNTIVDQVEMDLFFTHGEVNTRLSRVLLYARPPQKP